MPRALRNSSESSSELPRWSVTWLSLLNELHAESASYQQRVELRAASLERYVALSIERAARRERFVTAASRAQSCLAGALRGSLY
ncbi:UNVERIFIED_CONTAM: hypothetical protein FKN15_058719 [Acipenser sinensis]